MKRYLLDTGIMGDYSGSIYAAIQKNGVATTDIHEPALEQSRRCAAPAAERVEGGSPADY